MADLQEASVSLPTVPASVSTARGHVSNVLAEWGLPERTEAVDIIRLIVSELATNVVQHTGGRSPVFTVLVQLDRGELLRIGVADSHPRRPRRLPAAVQQDNGRGMVVVRTLTKELGGSLTITPTHDGGKTVWTTLPWTGPRAL
ncbi:ATP-binding protein [Streptomyces sp. NPDC057654]|uniref:ATP-binding protein n=1 Tax=Streptomyces sp. NPDC057654 TaxID=3346196 RepID=UPI0036BD662F